MIHVSLSSKNESIPLRFSLLEPDSALDRERRALTISRADWNWMAMLYLTDAERRDLIHELGGVPVEPAFVHAGRREAPADAPAEAS